MSRQEAHQARFFVSAGTFLAMIYVATGFGIFLSVADNYMRKNGMLPVPPTVASVAFLLSVISFGLLKDFLGRNPSQNLSLLLRANVAVILPFLMLAFISLLLAIHPTSYWGDNRKWIYLVTYDFFIFMCAMLLPSVEFIRKRFQFFVIVGLLTILGSIWYEVQNPNTFSTVPNRAAGFPSNSNWGALACVMICTMSLRYKEGPARILDLVLLAITGLGLYFTLSRSGTINFVLLLMFYIATAIVDGKNRVKTTINITVSALGLIVFFTLAVPLLSENSALMSGNNKAENRLLALADGDLADDGSSADRIQAAQETLDKIENSPVIGNGTGFNRKMRQTPHNLYLKLWVDFGIAGLSAWLCLLGCGFWTFTTRKYRPGQALIIATFIGSFFSHNILEQRTFLFLLGTASAVSLYESAENTKRREVSRSQRIFRSAALGPGLQSGQRILANE